MRRLLALLLLLPVLAMLPGCVVAPAPGYYGRGYVAAPVYARPYYGRPYNYGYGYRHW